MTKRILSILLVAIFTLSLVSRPAIPVFAEENTTAKASFSDVNSDDWFYDSVEFVKQNKLMQGVGDNKFAPKSNASRGMIVTVLYRLSGEEYKINGQEKVFSDIEEGVWYYTPVIWAKAKSIVNGYSEEIFGVNDNITRQDLAVILYNYAKSKDYVKQEENDLSKYKDVNMISDYAEEALSWANKNSLIVGTDDMHLNPKSNATRAEIATIFARFYKRFILNELADGEIPKAGIKNEFTVTFYENYANNNVYKKIKVVKGEKLALPKEPKRDGYNFIAWYKTKELKEKFDVNNDVTEDISLFAKWEERSSEYWDDSDDSSNSSVDIKEYYNVNFYLDSQKQILFKTFKVEKSYKVEKFNEPTKENYTFESWYIDENNKFDFNTSITSNIDVYAKWKENKEREREPFEDIGENYFKAPKPEDIIIDEETGLRCVKNQILVSAYKGLEKSVMEDIANEVGAKIVGYIELSNDYQLEFIEDKTSKEISQIIEYIDSYSFISSVTLNLVSEIEGKKQDDEYLNNITDDYLYKDGKAFIASEDDDWNESNPKGDNWNLEALRVPSVWKHKHEFNPVKVGVYDEGFYTGHEDLIFDDVANNTDILSEQSHGTHVAGIMAAQHNNGKGISGIATDTRLYAYSQNGNDYGSSMGRKIAFAKLIGNHVKVINVSLGYGPEMIFAASHPEIVKEGSELARKEIREESRILSEYLYKLISYGYEFVICVAAGNENNDYYILNDNERYGIVCIEKKYIPNYSSDEIIQLDANALYGSVLSAIKNNTVKERIIVVGAFGNGKNRNFRLSEFSNIGERVDFIAPGENILSAVPSNSSNKDHELGDGTSAATPHITSLVAMMYQVNPGLKARNIKTLISLSCKENINSGGIDYFIPDALECYKNAKKSYSGENDVDFPAGILTGYTKSYTDSLQNVKITALRKDSGDYNIEKHSFTFNSDKDGHYVQALPQGTYDLLVSKKGYLPYVCNDITIKPDETMYMENIILRKWVSLANNNAIKGNIKDALNGNAIGNANIKLRKGWNNTKGKYCKNLSGKITQIKTNSSGNFQLSCKAGAYTIEISKDGYVRTYYNVVSSPTDFMSESSQTDIVLTPVLPNNEYRIVLTWGSHPYDLDSHLSYYIGEKRKFHVYFSNKSGMYEGSKIAQLDLDDTTSYGPETITLNINKDLLKGNKKFVYSVHDYSNGSNTNSKNLSLSNATIHIYSGNKLIKKYDVPKNKVGTFWHVFDITSNGIKSFNDFYNNVTTLNVK